MALLPNLLRDTLRTPADGTTGSGGPGSRALNFQDPHDNLYAFGKMWGSFDDTPALGCFHGTMYASLPNKRAMPLFGYVGTGVIQSKYLDDGRVRMRGKETGFFTDLASGRILETWDNPFTGETVKVFDFLNDQVRGTLTAEMPRFKFGEEGDDDSPMHAGTGQQQGATVPFVLPWQVYGDQVLLEWDYAHEYTNPVDKQRFPRAHTGPVINPSEHFTIFTSLQQLQDRNQPSAYFQAGFSRLSPWWPWMHLGGSGVEGVMFGRMFSRKCRRGLDDLLPVVRERLETRHPEYLEAPEGWQDGQPISTWEAYAKQAPPEAGGPA